MVVRYTYISLPVRRGICGCVFVCLVFVFLLFSVVGGCLGWGMGLTFAVCGFGFGLPPRFTTFMLKVAVAKFFSRHLLFVQPLYVSPVGWRF